MRTRLLTCLIVVSLFTPSLAQAIALKRPQESRRHTEGEIIVKLRSVPDEGFLGKYGLTGAEQMMRHKPSGKAKDAFERFGLDRLYVLRLGRGNLEDKIDELKRDPNVEYAEPNHIYSLDAMPNDPSFPELWGLHNTGQEGGAYDADIDAVEAWDAATDTSVVVGIIDSGVDYAHPDLAGNIWTNPGEIPSNGMDDDANGFIDDYYGWNFITSAEFPQGTPDPMDDQGHGTHVAGIIAARGNNSLGVAGVNWHGKVAALKFLNASGWGSEADAARAVAYATMMGFKITNNSWGGNEYSQALYDAIAAAASAGSLFIASAGNSASDTDSFPWYPASYDLANIISVAATERDDSLAFFSNYGSYSVDLGAPGAEILSTVPSGPCTNCHESGYLSLSGTSMASPYVSGAAALLWGSDQSLAHMDIKDRILSLASKTEAMEGRSASGGRLNLGNLFETDTVPPAQISDLRAETESYEAVRLSWTAVGDDGQVGSAERYDLRYSASPIDETSFASAIKVSSEPRPGPSGATESAVVDGLQEGGHYYFAIRAIDNLGNASQVSNTASTSTETAVEILSDDMESGVNGWLAEGLWHMEGRRSASATTSWAYNSGSPEYRYDLEPRVSGNLVSQSFSLSGAELPKLRFKSMRHTPFSTLSPLSVKIRVDGVTKSAIDIRHDPSLSWVDQSIDLSPFASSSDVQIAFYFNNAIASGGATYEGWYIDDVEVIAMPGSLPPPPPVNTAPMASAGPDKSAFVTETLSFSAASSTDAEGPIAAYSWSFGDGSTATGAVVAHAYGAEGAYTVTLTVTDSGGLTDTDTAQVTVSKDSVTIPTATWSRSRKELIVEATSSAVSKPRLTVTGYGEMTYDTALGRFRLIQTVREKPGSVTVTSSFGGNTSKSVTNLK